MNTKRNLWAAVVVFAIPVWMPTSLWAAEPNGANSQQNKMAVCNQQAGAKKGEERKAFMSDCLKNKPATPETQQDKMKRCNQEATGKTGDDRKAFMSQCLKKSA